MLTLLPRLLSACVLTQFIKHSVGGTDFDDDEELERAVNAVLGHSILDDDGRDGVSDSDVSRADVRLLYSRQLGKRWGVRDTRHVCRDCPARGCDCGDASPDGVANVLAGTVRLVVGTYICCRAVRAWMSSWKG